ncbi:uncharacterized protein TNCV_2611581 [Trichonephila clavipes]|nr:uncharacterized protein TNCV_2611581 [Trichonephila clavipes]
MYQKFQQTRLPFNRHSRTPGHGLLVHGLLVHGLLVHGLWFTDSWFTDSWSRTAVHVSKGEKQEKRCLERPHLGETLAKQFLSLVVVTRCCLNFVGVLLVV